MQVFNTFQKPKFLDFSASLIDRWISPGKRTTVIFLLTSSLPLSSNFILQQEFWKFRWFALWGWLEGEDKWIVTSKERKKSKEIPIHTKLWMICDKTPLWTICDTHTTRQTVQRKASLGMNYHSHRYGVRSSQLVCISSVLLTHSLTHLHCLN